MNIQDEVALPFKNLEELYNNINNLIPWPNIVPLRKSLDIVYKGTETDLQSQRPDKLLRTQVPKTIVCHDYKGGYLEDRFINGSNQHNSYHFYNWNLIDTFIYFSHHFITIPPLGWINAAHLHGVEILGTLITEGNYGQSLWEDILKTIDSSMKFADALIKLLEFYKFDGWLLNVENELKSTDITKLVFFVQYLTEQSHKKIGNSKIIWYDSITNEGKLEWQNQLNNKNESFFSYCDGIFLNYNWTDEGLNKSRQNAGQRFRDIYVGLDVWGRGCPGGGGFNSEYALKKIRQEGLSVAIFAPAWTFEYFESVNFMKIEDIFWAQLKPHLFLHVPIFDNENFDTTFCRGVGKKYYEYGLEITFKDMVLREIVEKNNSFFNLSMQRYQTLLPTGHLKFLSVNDSTPFKETDTVKYYGPKHYVYELADEIFKAVGSEITFTKKTNTTLNKNLIEFTYDTSYYGGGCIQLINNNVSNYHRLFLVHVQFTEYIQARVIYMNSISSVEKNSAPILLLTQGSGLTRFFAKETIQYGLNWRMSIYHTNTKCTDEVGLSFPDQGLYYIGRLVLEPIKYPHRKRQRINSPTSSNSLPINATPTISE